MHGMGGLSGLPFPFPLQDQQANPGACSIGDLYAGACDPVQQRAAAVANVLQLAAQGVFFRQQPSPLEAIPYDGRAVQIQARKILAPPTAPGDFDGATAATELKTALEAHGGTVDAILTPADTATYVTVYSYEVQPGTRFVLKGVGAWGHDLAASTTSVRWRVSIGGSGRQISSDFELGHVATLGNPALLQAVLRQGQTLTIQARNLDTKAPSLVEVRGVGWEWASLSQEDSLQGLLPADYAQLPGRERFGPGGVGPGACAP